jgi:hypothetical protein
MTSDITEQQVINHLEHSCDEGSWRYDDSEEEVVDGTYQE